MSQIHILEFMDIFEINGGGYVSYSLFWIYGLGLKGIKSWIHGGHVSYSRVEYGLGFMV
ncbi:hypothetical protein QJS04_geneDACA001779 [Acorus gramineus]|uniref:Uncharacterized protein n=1 Tax=Acorus gramineus TaxID=55184 RepID=A0AAV9BGT1_ACOGR|nr:hypothetical protein QJS04_geneDACA001779 [Acorus gramineus]